MPHFSDEHHLNPGFLDCWKDWFASLDKDGSAAQTAISKTLVLSALSRYYNEVLWSNLNYVNTLSYQLCFSYIPLEQD